MLVGWREGWCWRGGVMLWPRGTDCTLRNAPIPSPTQPKYTNMLCPGQRLSTGSLNHHQFPSHGSWSHTTLLTSTWSHKFTLRKNPAQGWSSKHPQGNHRKTGISKMHLFPPQHSTLAGAKSILTLKQCSRSSC